MTAPGQGRPKDHPWEGIDLDTYENHMSDATVGQLQLLHQITGEQLTAAFAAANIHAIGALSCVIQLNEATGFVSPTQYAASFDALGAISSDIDPSSLATALEKAGFARVLSLSYPLHNGKTLVRQDFRPINAKTNGSV